jgi:hypothetical protein
MNTHKEVHPSPPQMGQYQNPGPNQPKNLDDRNILLPTEENILQQNHGRKYLVPHESTPNTSEMALDTVVQP